MHYSILIYGVEAVCDNLPEDQNELVLGKHRKLQAEQSEAGTLGTVARLMPTSTAVTVKSDNNNPIVVDGPFTETKEQFLGFYVIECNSIEEAIEAAKGLSWEGHVLEVRPVQWLGGGDGT